MIDILVQPRRDRRAAERFFRRLLKDQGGEPRRLVTDKLRSYSAARVYAVDETWPARWLGRDPQLLTSGPVWYSILGSSRDGRQVLAAYGRRAPLHRLMRFEASSGMFEPLLGGESAIHATPSPDGEWLAWISYPGGTLWRSRPDGSDRIQLTSPPTVAFRPRWSWDGERIVFLARSETDSSVGGGLHVVSADGTAEEPIASLDDSTGGYWDPCWLPDVSIVFSGLYRPGLLRWEPTTRAVEPLSGAEDFMYPRCSRKGDLLAANIGSERPPVMHWTLRRAGHVDWEDLGPFADYVNPGWTRDARSVCLLGVSRRSVDCLSLDTLQMVPVADTSSLGVTAWPDIAPWMGLDAEDRPMVTAASGAGTTGLVALELETP